MLVEIDIQNDELLETINSSIINTDWVRNDPYPLKLLVLSEIDTSITHITPKDGNIFEELGFELREAAKLKIKSQVMCQISE